VPINLNVTEGPPGTPFMLESDTWAGGTMVKVTFLSDPIELGDLEADGDGVVQGSFVVPAVEPGAHTVQLDGTGADDEPQSLSTGFTVTAPASGGGGTGTATGAPVTTVAGTQAAGPLAFSGASSRDLASAAVLLIAAGLVVLDISIRRRTVRA
jgi:hypothetical protein